jgi:hypothetical protein
MDKVKLLVIATKKQPIEYNGVRIEVGCFLSAPQQVFLINQYLKEYFSKFAEPMVEVSDYSYIEAEFGLKNYIFQSNTNIDTENMDTNAYVDSQLWQVITSEITNYGDFRNKLNFIIGEVKEQIALKNSIGNVLSGLIEKAYALFEKINLASPEEIKEMQEKSGELLKEIESSSILKDAQASIEDVKPGKI